jgi:D-proline reductase (dithiol) PrdB
MNESRVTPINRFRERAVRWMNDTQAGQRFARWFGKTAGGLQWRLLMKVAGVIPWTPLKRPLSEATIAIVTTSGVHLCSDQPFDLPSDASFRAIPRSTKAQEICITHANYDRRDAERDLNLVFPLERLQQLEAEGVVGHVADVHYSFGFTKDPRELLPPARKVGNLLAKAHVDLVVLVPA